MLLWLLTLLGDTNANGQLSAFSAAGTDLIDLPAAAETSDGFRWTPRETLPGLASPSAKQSQPPDSSHSFHDCDQVDHAIYHDDLSIECAALQHQQRQQVHARRYRQAQDEGVPQPFSHDPLPLQYGTFSRSQHEHHGDSSDSARHSSDGIRISRTCTRSQHSSCDDHERHWTWHCYCSRHRFGRQEESLPQVRRPLHRGRDSEVCSAGGPFVRNRTPSHSLEEQTGGGRGVLRGETLVSQGGAQSCEGGDEGREEVVRSSSLHWWLLGWGVVGLDGVDDENALSRRKVLDPVSVLDGAADVPKRKPVGEGRVLDRIRELEKRQSSLSLAPITKKAVVPRKPLPASWKQSPLTSPAPASKASDTKLVSAPSKQQAHDGQSDVPFVFPLHIKRFKRRTSTASPVRPETPLYRSSEQEPELEMHAPRARRSIPILENQPHTPPPPLQPHRPADTPDNAPHDNHATTVRPTLGPKQPQTLTSPPVRPTRQPGRPVVSPVAFLHGTKENCMRHGRRKATKDMMEKGRNGVYSPTGLVMRRQMEATSPWIMDAKKVDLTSNPGGLSQSKAEACPDCVAELSIRRREVMESQMNGMPPTVGEMQHGTPWVPRITPRVVDAPAARQPGTINHAVTTTTDLPNGLDAAIFERGGALERVLLSHKPGQPAARRMQVLSRSLLNVSHALASVGFTDHTAPFTADTMPDRALIINYESVADQKSATPELLDMIDNTMKSIHSRGNYEPAKVTAQSHLSAPSDAELIKDRQSLLEDDEVDKLLVDGLPSPIERLVHRQRYFDDPNLWKRVANGSEHDGRQAAHSVLTNGMSDKSAAKKNEAKRTDEDVPAIIKTPPSTSDHASLAPSPVQSTLPTSPAVTRPNVPSSELCATPHVPKSTTATPTNTTRPPQSSLPAQSDKNATYASITGILQPITSPLMTTLDPLKQAAKAVAMTSNPPPIARNPNPYHHAPAAPRHPIDSWAQSARHVIRNAMNMEKCGNGVSLAQAAKAEREVRRRRSTAVLAKGGV